MKNERPTWWHLLFYFTSYVLNMFRTLIYRFAGWSCVSAWKTSTTQNQPHQISNTQRAENKTTYVVIQQHSRKLLVMDILMSETCWAHKKWNKIASDIKLVIHSSTITMMHGPINISKEYLSCNKLCTYGIGKHHMLKTLQWEKLGSYEAVCSTGPLTLLVSCVI